MVGGRMPEGGIGIGKAPGQDRSTIEDEVASARHTASRHAAGESRSALVSCPPPGGSDKRQQSDATRYHTIVENELMKNHEVQIEAFTRSAWRPLRDAWLGTGG